MDLCKTDTNFTFEGGGVPGGAGPNSEGANGHVNVPNDPGFNIENMMRRRASDSFARKDSNSLVLSHQPSFSIVQAAAAAAPSNNNNIDEIIEEHMEGTGALLGYLPTTNLPKFSRKF